MTMTVDEYRSLMESEDLAPHVRNDMRRRYEAAVKRAEYNERLTAERRRQLAVSKWQQETLRELRKVFSEQFEVVAWEAREKVPLWALEARHNLERRKGCMAQRIRRARRESAEGCGVQAQWLARHAEIIAALEPAG